MLRHNVRLRPEAAVAARDCTYGTSHLTDSESGARDSREALCLFMTLTHIDVQHGQLQDG